MRTAHAVPVGLIATAAMTALLLIEPSVGLPQIAIGQLLSTSLSVSTAHLTLGPGFGWALHFVVGCVWAVVYVALVRDRLPGGPLARGLAYGGLLFLLAQLVFMPLVGGGVFSRGSAALLAGSLLGHLVYGGVLGWVLGLTEHEGVTAVAALR